MERGFREWRLFNGVRVAVATPLPVAIGLALRTTAAPILLVLAATVLLLVSITVAPVLTIGASRVAGVLYVVGAVGLFFSLRD